MGTRKEGNIPASSFAAPDKAVTWRRKAEKGEPRGDLAADGPTLITEATYNELFIAYNLGIDQKTRDIGYDISGDYGESPFYRGITISEGYLSDMYTADTGRNGVFTHIDSWITSRKYERYGRNGAIMKNGACVGITAVLKAFHLELGSGFIDRLMSAPPTKLMPAFEKRKKEHTPSEAISVIDRIKAGNQIPTSQVFFNKFLGELLEDSTPEVLDGAETMYAVIEELWPELKQPDPRQEHS